MVHMHAVKSEQLARLLQKELGMLFLQEAAALLGPSLVSVTAVTMRNADSSARVYLSVALYEQKAVLLQKITRHKNSIRKLLAKRIAHKMRRVPDLKFYIDNTVRQGDRITSLIDQLDLSMDN
ncbi:ribosome-binding factor A [Candidatus Cardinium hertigii]|nr:ribosome-binding factor A [Candidatus Cardinium hertigii]